VRFRLPARNLLCWKLLAVSGFLLGAVWGCSGESEEQSQTSCDGDDHCFGERVRATFEVTGIYSSDRSAVIVDGPDIGFELSGYTARAASAYLCETELKWEQQNVTDRPEIGCWTFNGDQTFFYKHSYRLGSSLVNAPWPLFE